MEPALARVQMFVGCEWTRPLSPVATQTGCHPADKGLVLCWFRELNHLTLMQARLHQSKKNGTTFWRIFPISI